MTVDVSDLTPNPYPIFRRLRAEAPVCRLEPHGFWLISRHSDVLAILKDAQTFSSSQISEPETGLTGAEFLMKSRGLIGADRPDHTRLRRLIAKAFTPNIVGALEPRIGALCRRLAAKLDTPTDFVTTMSAPLPIAVISELMGVDATRTTDIKRWTDLLLTWRRRPSQTGVAQDISRMHDYLTELIHERTRYPQCDLISELIKACESNARLSAEEVLGFARLLLVAGSETTTHLLSNVIVTLDNHSEIWMQLKADPSLAPAIVDETLRLDSPALSLIRRANVDVQIGGTHIAKNDIVLPLLASANHDELVFSSPEKFLLDRKAPHLSFGFGAHFCLGSNLARLQVRIAVEEIAARFKGLRVQQPISYLNSFFFRGPERLFVEFSR